MSGQYVVEADKCNHYILYILYNLYICHGKAGNTRARFKTECLEKQGFFTPEKSEKFFKKMLAF